MTRILHLARTLLEGAMMLLLGGIVALTFADVIGRRIFGVPIFGAHDVTEHLMALIIFLGLPLLTILGGHLTIDLFDRFLLQPQLRLWRFTVALIVAAVFLLIGLLFWEASVEARQFQETSMALRIPRQAFYLFFSASACIASIGAVLRGFAEWRMTPEQLSDKSGLEG